MSRSSFCARLREACKMLARTSMQKSVNVVMVTGGAGYIGSHTTLLLLQAGYTVIVLDNLSNSSAKSLKRVSKITGKTPTFIKGDVRDRSLLARLFAEQDIGAVFHFAGLKSVEESVHKPIKYYENNLVSTLALCEAMSNAGVFRLVFSSSATVYGDQPIMPCREDIRTSWPISPYGRTKLMVEEALKDLALSDNRWWIGLLRYFNPVGAHESGLIGEDPRGTPNNLMPYIAQVAIGRHETLSIYGNDYPTVDGTGVRDYIHVMDLAEGHIKALEAGTVDKGAKIWNLGTGTGASVLEVVNAFEDVCGHAIPRTIMPRRHGDVPECWADPSKAEQELGWRAHRDLKDMVRDTWNWQSNNPLGFDDSST